MLYADYFCLTRHIIAYGKKKEKKARTKIFLFSNVFYNVIFVLILVVEQDFGRLRGKIFSLVHIGSVLRGFRRSAYRKIFVYRPYICR